jgi:hypothetical protein
MTLFLWLAAFGLIAGAIGKSKGSSFFIWFLLGFCLPVIGVAAAILHRNENAEPRRECPDCGKLHAAYVQVCNRCGCDMDYPEELIVSRDMERQLRAGGANGGGE